MNWIKVTDKLPKYLENVLLYGVVEYSYLSKSKEIKLGYRNKTDSNGENYVIIGGNEKTIIKVTHWMYLPEPPKD